MKVVQKRTTNIAGLKTMIGRVQSGSYVAYEIEQKDDAGKVGREIEAFIGKDLKPVTVIIVKGI